MPSHLETRLALDDAPATQQSKSRCSPNCWPARSAWEQHSATSVCHTHNEHTFFLTHPVPTSTPNPTCPRSEPDQYGPSCVGSWNPPAYGCAPGAYRQATSSGWFPLFDPSVGNADQWHASHFWQQTVNNLTAQSAYPHPSISKIVSPSMAQAAGPGPSCLGVDPSLPGNPKTCPGWLAAFKSYTMQLDCRRMDGTQTNCWDVIDTIQIHAYAKRPSDVINKVQGYGKVFADDFAGTNGRSKKTLWITELAMGSDNATEIVPFIEELFRSKGGLTDTKQFPYLEAVSWFSDEAFSSFNVSGIAPRPNEVWVSTLFNPFGGLNAVGNAFFKSCKQ